MPAATIGSPLSELSEVFPAEGVIPEADRLSIVRPAIAINELELGKRLRHETRAFEIGGRFDLPVSGDPFTCAYDNQMWMRIAQADRGQSHTCRRTCKLPSRFSSNIHTPRPRPLAEAPAVAYTIRTSTALAALCIILIGLGVGRHFAEKFKTRRAVRNYSALVKDFIDSDEEVEQSHSTRRAHRQKSRSGRRPHKKRWDPSCTPMMTPSQMTPRSTSTTISNEVYMPQPIITAPFYGLDPQPSPVVADESANEWLKVDYDDASYFGDGNDEALERREIEEDGEEAAVQASPEATEFVDASLATNNGDCNPDSTPQDFDNQPAAPTPDSIAIMDEDVINDDTKTGGDPLDIEQSVQRIDSDKACVDFVDLEEKEGQNGICTEEPVTDTGQETEVEARAVDSSDFSRFSGEKNVLLAPENKLVTEVLHETGPATFDIIQHHPKRRKRKHASSAKKQSSSKNINVVDVEDPDVQIPIKKWPDKDGCTIGSRLPAVPILFTRKSSSLTNEIVTAPPGYEYPPLFPPCRNDITLAAPDRLLIPSGDSTRAPCYNEAASPVPYLPPGLEKFAMLAKVRGYDMETAGNSRDKVACNVSCNDVNIENDRESSSHKWNELTVDQLSEILVSELVDGTTPANQNPLPDLDISAIVWGGDIMPPEFRSFLPGHNDVAAGDRSSLRSTIENVWASVPRLRDNSRRVVGNTSQGPWGFAPQSGCGTP